ncbi:MAG: heavy-metal-associated domain-containing protein [Paracoccus sp. (in: a-proteobacteria)]|uniref:heavy-metal-associated domain-containing protein n=1 Tax=Paracoccus sp. TaxID=267 RepID=UPI0039E547E5
MRFRVKDMSCGHCTASIEAAIAQAGGRARAELATLSVEVEGLAPERAAEVIRAAGYSPEPA